ncbi:MAG: hypothetical protein ACREM1_12800 [Longimicrobiales bacterium]
MSLSPQPSHGQRNRERDEPGVADRADYDPTYDADAPILCDVCGSAMDYSATCRIVCRNCGYTRDCEDP